MKGLRAAVVSTIALSAFAVNLAAAPLVNLDQNWSGKDIKTWYDATQGSRLMPLDWFLALKQPDSSSRFLADEHIAKFGYLPRPGQLPVGFARDDTPADQLAMTALRWTSTQKANENWIGLNCAACHTGEITYRGSRMRVEGGLALDDFQGLIEALNRSLIQTRDQPDKFERFASRVLAKSNNKASDRELLKKACPT